MAPRWEGEGRHLWSCSQISTAQCPKLDGGVTASITKPPCSSWRLPNSAHSRGVGELHTLGERRLVGEVERARAPAHVLLPRISAGLATPPGALHRGSASEVGSENGVTCLVSAERGADFCAASADVDLVRMLSLVYGTTAFGTHVHNASVRAGGADPLADVAHVTGPETAAQALHTRG